MHSVAIDHPAPFVRSPSRASTGHGGGDGAFSHWLDQPDPAEPRRAENHRDTDGSDAAKPAGASAAAEGDGAPQDRDEAFESRSSSGDPAAPIEQADARAPASPSDGGVMATHGELPHPADEGQPVDAGPSVTEAAGDEAEADQQTGVAEEQPGVQGEPSQIASLILGGKGDVASATARPTVQEDMVQGEMEASPEAPDATADAIPRIGPAKTVPGSSASPADRAAAAVTPPSVSSKGGETTLAPADEPVEGQGSSDGEMQARVADDAKAEDETALRSKVAGEDVASRTERARPSRPFEPFAAVRAGADAVQNLNQAMNHGTAHLTSPAQPSTISHTMPSAPAMPLANPPAMPVPMSGVGVEIAAQALAGRNRFEIRLDPPELGRIDVRLDIDKDGKVTTRLTVERVETLDIVRRDAPQLERALQQAGLKTSDQPIEFSLRDQGTGHHGGHDDSAGAAAGHDSDDGTDDPIIRPARIIRAGGVDIRI